MYYVYFYLIYKYYYVNITLFLKESVSYAYGEDFSTTFKALILRGNCRDCAMGLHLVRRR